MTSVFAFDRMIAARLFAGLLLAAVAMMTTPVQAAETTPAQSELIRALEQNDTQYVANLLNAAGEPGQVCQNLFSEGEQMLDSNVKLAADLLEQSSNCCSADLDTANAEQLTTILRSIVSKATTLAATGENTDDTGRAMAAALACAGQPSVVAVAPELYSEILTEASNNVQIARGDGNADIQKQLQLARQNSLRPNNNQLPTTTLSLD